MESPFRRPEELAPPQSEARAPMPRPTPHYRYEQPPRRAAARVFSVSCAVLVGVIAAVAYHVASAHELPSAWFERAGLASLLVCWVAWLVMRDRFALELHPESGALLVLRCPAIFAARWRLVREVPLSAVDGVDLRGLRGRRQYAVLVLRSWAGAETEVRLGWMRDDRHLAALAHWVEQARVIAEKLERPQ
jgi:hypothetical protein